MSTSQGATQYAWRPGSRRFGLQCRFSAKGTAMKSPTTFVAMISRSALLGCGASTGQLRHPSLLSRSERNALLLTAADSSQGPECRVSSSAPPALGQIADSVRLIDALSRWWPNGLETIMITVAVDSTGRTNWVDVLETAPVESSSEGIVAAISGSLMAVQEPDRAPANRGWRHRFRFSSGSTEPVVEVGPTVECRPVLLNAEQLASAMSEEIAVRGPAMARYMTGAHETRIWLKVAATGRPDAIRVNRTSGNPTLDDIAAEIARMGRFSAARSDGRPVEVWVQLPMTFRYPSNRKR